MAPAKRSQIGKGTFEIRQNGMGQPSAWVASDGALNQERWIWISKANGTGDPARVLEMSAVAPPAANDWAFTKVVDGTGETSAELIVRARASAPAAKYDLLGRIHTKSLMPGL